MIRRRGWTGLSGGAVLALLMASLTAPAAAAQPDIPAAGAVSSKNMEWVANVPDLAGTALDFFERVGPDGSTKRYVVAATHGNGFDIIDVTDPEAPVTAGRYVSPTRIAGFNFHPWVQVNPRRNIVALSIQEPGASATHGGMTGVEFVDITDVTNPTQLGQVAGLQGPHSIRMIGNNHVYTTLPTHIIDYSDPQNPRDLGQQEVCGRRFSDDPNHPGRTYVGFCGSFRWGVLDTTDPANPTVISEVNDQEIVTPYEVFPAPDSSFVGVADVRGGIPHLQCPGGGIHFYDISGKYVPGASPEDPRKMGTWFAPFGGADVDRDSDAPNWGSCTMHSWQLAPERLIVAAGLFMGGSWVMNPTEAPKNLEGGGEYDEWDGEPGPGLGPTTWGNTTGNFLAEGDYVTASQWLPFDLADPEAERLVYTNGLFRGIDVYRYTGPLPEKTARLRVDGQAVNGAVTGVLDRYAVLTHRGWENKPLAGKQLTVTAGGTSVTVVTESDGSFSADLGLPAGSHEVTVAWAGDDAYQPASVTRAVDA